MREWSNRLSRVAPARGVVEPLEPRRLLCYGPDATAYLPTLPAGTAGSPASAAEPSAALSAAPLNPSGLPLLHSLPGARGAVFLDFDGYGALYAPYDTDGSPATFGAAERAAIEHAWRHVGSYFSMFDLDVTTEHPAPGTPLSYSIISNSVLTVAYNSGAFPSPLPLNFHPPADAASRPTALAHEVGHSFGLMHQGTFDRRGKLVSEYSEGYDALHGSLMGIDFARDVQKWFIGHPSNSPSTLQDEVAAIAAGVRAAAGGDGFRPDDVPDALGNAVSLTADGQGRRAASGIIERMNDADAYSFEAGGGGFRIDVVPPAPSMLDAKLEVYASDGSLVAAADAATNDQHLVLPWLAEGTYYAVVKSHGNYGDLGPYDLSVEATVGVVPEAPPGGAPAPPAAGVELGEGTGVRVAWDAVAGGAGYVVERSDDGATWQQAGEADGTATTFDDAPPLGGRRYFYRVSAVGAGGRSAPSAVVHVVNRAAPPADVSVTFVDVGIILNWRDTSGETGYRVYRRTQIPGDEPGPWALLAELGPNVPSVADLSLPAARCGYRVAAVSPDGEVSSGVVIGGSTFDRITGMRAVVPPGTHAVRLDWDRVPFAVGYVVERSTDGVAFARVADVTTNSYTDDDLVPAKRYFYRVVGTDDLGFSKVSGAVWAVTPGTPLPEGWAVADIGGAALGEVGRVASGAVTYQPESGAFSMIGGGDGFINPQGQLLKDDSFRFVYTTLAGDGSITARIVPDEAAPAGLGFSGLMFRDGLNPGAPYVFTGTSRLYGRAEGARPSGMQVGYSAGGPLSVRILRIVDAFYLYELVGTAWFETRMFQIPMGESLQVGLVCSSGGDATLASATFENVKVVEGALLGPRLVTPAAASPAVVTLDYVDLSVWATDVRGDGTLVYHWSLESGPDGVPAPEFQANHSNAARYVTARLFGAGTYVFRVTITNAAGLSVESTVGVRVLPTVTGVTITPRAVLVRAGDSVQFTATVIDQFGWPIDLVATRKWYTTYGRVDSGGRYTAPPHATSEGLSVEVNGWWAFASIAVYDDVSPGLLSAVSRKVHAGRGPVDLPLALYGAPAVVEPRRGGPTTLVLTFSGDVVAADGSLDESDFTIEYASFRSARIDGKVLTIELQDVRDRSRVSVRVTGVAGAGGGNVIGADVKIQTLHGDANRDGVLNAADVTALRTQVARRTGPTDLLHDLDLDGFVSAADQAAARRRMVSTVLAAPQAVSGPRTAPARRSGY